MSVFAIAAVAAVAGVGSYALWSDSESSNGNYIVADYLDLVINPTTIAVVNARPGQSGSADIMATNNSNQVTGELSIQFTNYKDYENGCVEPEYNTLEGNDTTCDLTLPAGATIPSTPATFTGTGTDGELGANVLIWFDVDINNDGVIDYTTSATPVPLNTLATLPATVLTGQTLAAGGTAKVTVHWSVNNSTTPFADNIFMTDAVVVDATVTLTQNN